MVWKILIVDDWCGDITIRDGIWLGHFPTHFTILFIPKWVLLIYAVRWLIFIPCDSIGESDSIYSYTCMAQNEALQQKFNRFYPVQMNCGKVDSEMTDCSNRISSTHHYTHHGQGFSSLCRKNANTSLAHLSSVPSSFNRPRSPPKNSPVIDFREQLYTGNDAFKRQFRSI